MQDLGECCCTRVLKCPLVRGVPPRFRCLEQRGGAKERLKLFLCQFPFDAGESLKLSDKSLRGSKKGARVLHPRLYLRSLLIAQPGGKERTQVKPSLVCVSHQSLPIE